MASAFILGLTPAFAAPHAIPFEALSGTLNEEIRPLIQRLCLDCHDDETKKGDLDLERFTDLAAIRKEPAVWQEVLRQLVSGEMPPEKKPQPSDTERAELISWVRSYLNAEALAQAGDPGPVVLRRLSNAEYTYTLRDLTGVQSLDPVREFPVDGAAGEGFTNTGAALVMSPALFSKYFDAAKAVARHAVLLPDGIVFSEKNTRHDWAEEKLQAIRAFYAQSSVGGEGIPVNLQGIKFNTRDAGLLPLEKYIKATIVEREALLENQATLSDVAIRYGLNGKYLANLWAHLTGKTPSLLLDPIRAQWQKAKPEQATEISRSIGAWQKALWRFATIGHIGKRDGPKAWQLPVDPLATAQEIKLKLPDEDCTLYLVTSDAGDGNGEDFATWENPRIVYPDRPPLHLRDVQVMGEALEARRSRELKRTAEYLHALAEMHMTEQPTDVVAKARKLDPVLLASWAGYVQLGRSKQPEVKGHYTEKINNNECPVLRGWGSHQTPSLAANKSDQVINVSTLTVPARSVIMHPSPQKEAILYWRSPMDGKIQLEGLVADADNKCGNGATWRVELITHAGPATIASGVLDNGAKQAFKPESVFEIRKGALVMLAVNPRDRNHTCDTTHVELIVKEIGSTARVWDLAKDVVDRIQDSNPLADAFGHADTWHFCASEDGPLEQSGIPPGSTLASWRGSVMDGKADPELEQAARSVQSGIDSDAPADEKLRQELHAWQGPLNWLQLASGTASKSTAANLDVQAPSVLTFRLPKGLAKGGELVTKGMLHPEKGRNGSVQMRAQLTEPSEGGAAQPGSLQPAGRKSTWSDGLQPVVSDAPFLVQADSATRKRLLEDFAVFRELFPAALCYSKIVPVDEVVTLTLYYREDDHLKRLMLDDAQAAALDQLWDELRFVSHEPLKLVDAFEQLWQYATQDADPSAFTPMREPIKQRAATFRKDLVAAEKPHVKSVIHWAEKAWRRPLSRDEQKEIVVLYQTLRKQEMAHDDAIRMALARLFVAPEFLYKLEQPVAGTKASAISDLELATRLSYFLWSSMPDDELMSLARTGKLQEPDVLAAQARRMLQDPRTRRLAQEFGCQWLGVRDFANLDEKSERHFPEFAELRGPMEEEVTRFFTEFFSQNGSILSLLDADHTYVNTQLAKFYSMPAPNTAEWVRVEGLRDRSRGGVLGMASTLARQSGASRTSPILRGNWIYESLLGQHLPRPPKDVPQLPDTVPEGLTERQMIEQHSSNPGCAKCHVKIDAYGFALEGFDAIGRARSGHDTRAKVPTGQEIDGLSGLRGYLLGERREEFVRQFCRKLLGYALGRSVQLSDEPFLDALSSRLPDNEYHVHFIAEQIVRSPQFRMIRGKDRKHQEVEEAP